MRGGPKVSRLVGAYRDLKYQVGDCPEVPRLEGANGVLNNQVEANFQAPLWIRTIKWEPVPMLLGIKNIRRELVPRPPGLRGRFEPEM